MHHTIAAAAYNGEAFDGAPSLGWAMTPTVVPPCPQNLQRNRPFWKQDGTGTEELLRSDRRGKVLKGAGGYEL